MKKVNLLLVVLFALTMGFMSSCNPEEADKPSLVVSEVTGATYAQGSVVTYEVIISSNADLKSFTASPSVVGGDGTGVIVTNPADALTDGTFTGGLNSVTVTYAYAVPATGIAAGSEVSIEFYVEDDVANETVTKTFTVVSSVNRFTAVLMGAQANLTEGSYLDAATGTVYTQNDAFANQALVDIVYYFGSTNAATLCAPNEETINGGAASNLTLCESWTTKNATVFGASTVTVTEFDAMIDDSVIAEITGLTESISIDLAVDAIIAFETVNGEKGLIKIVALEATTAGTITIEVLIQE